jgi:hypothetical protein
MNMTAAWGRRNRLDSLMPAWRAVGDAAALAIRPVSPAIRGARGRVESDALHRP